MNGKTLEGVWELRGVSGGMMVYDPTRYRPGNGSRWAFTPTRFARVYRDSVYQSGSYLVSQGSGMDLNSGRKVDRFVFNNQPSACFELSNDTLRFYYGLVAADGEIDRYVKITEDTTAVH